ncbi:MAG: hypothetical protein AB8G05_11200 [Oligoflexales bacterium]
MELSHYHQKIIEEHINDQILRADTQHGGCISESFKITSKQGNHYFAKTQHCQGWT